MEVEMPIVRRLTAEQEMAVLTSIKLLLESRPQGIHVLAPRQQIAASLAFRITETALRGKTLTPVPLGEADVAGVIAHFPHKRPDERERAKIQLTVLLREAINSGRLVAAEKRSTLGGITRNLPEYAVMTIEQWRRLQTIPKAALGATYRRALTSR
jgi:hypothetical protein